MRQILILFSLLLFQMSNAQKVENNIMTLLKGTNFYFLEKLSNQEELQSPLFQNRVFKTIAKSKSEAISHAISSKGSLEKVVGAYMFTDVEITSIVEEFIRLHKENAVVQNLFSELRNSGKYRNFNSQSDSEFIQNVIELNLKGLNHTLGVYGLGHKPFYPKIDSVSYDTTSRYFYNAVFFWSKHMYENQSKSALFFESSLDFALSLMYMNHRDEAVRYEPLDEEYNAKAIQYVKEVDFKAYDYNALIVLGDGPENYRDPLAALGKLNLKIAVEQFNLNKAPFIIVSGGHVHPNRTQTCEAIEMKNELMDVYGIPEKNIIIEPYARHTTTNLRNATRLMLRYGFDIKQKSLIVSFYHHLKSIESQAFNERFMRELGYLPGEIISLTDGAPLEFIPSEVMTHQNPLEPLDP